jgi:hypothetical protein
MSKKSIIMALVVLCSLSSLVFMQTKTESIASTVIVEPQTKCENGLIYVQFQGTDGWFRTEKKCDMRAEPPKLDTTYAGGLTQVQLDALVKSYLSGHPEPVGKNVCCCQPGWRVYDNSHQTCMRGKLSDK